MPVVRDWRMRDFSQDEVDDTEERAAIIADGCRIDQESALTRAIEMARKSKREAK